MKQEFKLVELHDVTNHPIVQKKLARANELLSKTDLSPIYERRKQREEAKKKTGI
ncbi:hypothetical protein [Dyadobacter chenhuakuii]|uniref:Uncharacterized protein n=1 Tax=Dyadobacter chenhuakuii TaxID=2909339 RepID=A0ABY4XEA2_9BACT|nr:hypothetical protein [Dyadobacter chenhuakuii]MCF2492134.1 hypothetical protein [Dyadobacter chenhuakuii]USJ28709.1 hypothetical protein NFI80_12565 [Dyadobacter chenhuakuii]